ncbi:pyruvate dehydrogenase (acetyl-transferring) kinase, mitochondrial-like isoform X1 [Palaemon carinicauda]
MKEFSLLPENLLLMPSTRAVQDLYCKSFGDLMEFEGKDANANLIDKFTDALTKIRNRHQDVVMTMAQGIMELKDAHRIDNNMEAYIQYFLDRFYMNRISIRMLINQHTLLFGDSINSHHHIGCIDPHCDIVRVIEDAYSNARFLCDQYYLASPELVVKHHNEHDKKTKYIKEAGKSADRTSVSVVYVPSHLYHMLFELFKNAMRAVVEHHSNGDDNIPPLEVLLVKGTEDLTIKLSDQGGGIPRSHMDLLFNYMYSTAPQPAASGMETPPLAGYGYGLPLSRLYARYFHGDLVLTSFEGYGTDACIFLKALSSEANELLPVYNKTCQRQYSTPIQTHDWSSQGHSAMFVRPFSTNSLNKLHSASS